MYISGIREQKLIEVYENIKKTYIQEGYPEVYLNALKKARLYLKRNPAPQHIRYRTWFVGSSRNWKRIQEGETPIGYECQPWAGRCACQSRAATKKQQYDTCVQQEVVRLYIEATDDDDIRRLAKSEYVPRPGQR